MLFMIEAAFLPVPGKASDLLSAWSWHHIALDALRGLRLGILLFLVIFLIERFYKVPASRYKSRNFLHDICYWFYGRSDFHRILFTASLFSFLGSQFAFIEIVPVRSMPAPLRWAIYFISADFTAYWIHRWQHSSRFLWAFHGVHHSQEQLTFATSTRSHPIDNFMTNTLAFIPLMLLGQPVRAWLPVYYIMEFLIAIEHSGIPWRFGFLYGFIVSPAFHSFHHSIRQEHHDRNFGRILSVWDYLFGTAVSDRERPVLYGLEDWKMPTLMSQLCSPFVYLYKDAVKAKRTRQSAQELTRSNSV